MKKQLELQQKAQAAFEHKNYDLALQLYDDCIKINPNNLDNYLAIIFIYILLGEEEKIAPFYLSLICEGNFNEEEVHLKLIHFLDQEFIKKYNLGELETAKRIFFQLKELDENHLNSEINLPEFFQKVTDQIILKLSLNHRHEEAIKEFENLLIWDNTNHELWNLLATSYLQNGQPQPALEAILTAIDIAPSVAKYHYNLGVLAQNCNQLDVAIQAYEKALELDDKFLGAYNNLANILMKNEGQIDEAQTIYQKLIEIAPEHPGHYINLGNIFMIKQDYDLAIENYKKALNLQRQDWSIQHNIALAYQAKNDPEANFYFGYSKYRKNEYQEAISYFNKYLEKELGDLNLYTSLADCYLKLNDVEQCIATYFRGMEKLPHDYNLYRYLMELLQHLGRIDEALEIGEKALAKFPDNLTIIRRYQSILPILYKNTEEIEFHRQRFSKYLDILIEKTDLFTHEKIDETINSVTFTTNFFLQYQGKNDLDLQVKYAEYIHKIMLAKYPQFTQKLTLNKNREKIRVGYISYLFRNHTIGKLYLGWLKNLDKNKFEVYCYYLDRNFDSLNKQFEACSTKFTVFNNKFVEEICDQIIEDELDILVYPDIGMYPTLTLLSTLRLAPIQCVSWGHPITTGSPNIDYFISSNLMEPENGEKHYSEKLIRLPNLSIYYEKPILPEKTKNRAEFNLDSERIVYLSCQSLFKYLPQYDYIFPEIAVRNPRAQFAFLSGDHLSSPLTEQFKQRLEKAFNKYDLNYQDYCVIIRRLEQLEYWNLNLVSDIYLDTIAWSGGNTTLEAIACNLPIVTYPGEFMRGRHSYAMLRVLEVTETIANSPQEYIEIAVKLGLDEDFRKEIKEKIKLNHHKIYNDLTCIKALEDFYIQAVNNYPELEE